ncbi:NADH-quinone oxidoreductase subunit N [candidate division KSB1 bacterium]
MNIYQDIQFFYPELVLGITILVVIIADLVTSMDKKLINPMLSVIGLIVSIYFSIQLLDTPDRMIFGNMLIVDKFSIFFRIFFAFSTTIIIFISLPTFRKSGEYYALLLATTMGMYLMASSVHIAMIILSLEIVGVGCYVLAGYRKYELRSSEAALKYMLYGAVSTGVMLYGFSFLYGLTNQLNLYAIGETLRTANVDSFVLLVSVLFILAGIGYKIAMVPFHFWCPDVYEGAPTPITTFFSVGPKMAGVALLARFIYAGLSSQIGVEAEAWSSLNNLDLPLLLAVLSAITMTLGNMSALAQSNLKRLLAYSSIAHAGYILMGFAIFTGQGLTAILFYAIVYMFMNFGAFAVVDAIAHRIKSEELEDYRGIGSRAPFLGFAMIVFLVSLTGLPPTAGFIGKFMLFAALINGKLYWLAVVGALNSVVSLYYYFRVAKAMYLKDTNITDTSPIQVSTVHLVVIAVLLIPTIIFGVFWAPLVDWTAFGLNFIMPV